MKKEDFEKLKVGDIVRHLGNGHAYIITADFGDRKTAVNTADITNPKEWELLLKVNYTEQSQEY